MIKAVFFDVDGTLVSHTSKSIPESAKLALDKLREKGIKIFLSTGRHIHELKNLPIQGIDFDGYILLNGQVGLDKDKNIIFSKPFEKEDKEELLNIFYNKEYPFVLVNKDGHYMNYINEVVEIALDSVSTKIPPIKDYEGEDIFQATVFIPTLEDENFSKKLPKGCKLARWGHHGADVIAAEGGKAAGMRLFGELLDILPEEMMAFGDAENDMDMITYAGIGVAMGNGKDCLKYIADHVTADIEEDGILLALQKFGLIE